MYGLDTAGAVEVLAQLRGRVWEFLALCRLYEQGTGRPPRHSWVDKTAGYRYWTLVIAAPTVEAALAEALKRVRAARDKTGADWRVDEDVHRRTGERKNWEDVYIGDMLPDDVSC